MGKVSSRKFERACYGPGFPGTDRQQTGNRSLITEFRRRYLDSLKNLAIQILGLCQKPGPVSLGHVSLDGARFQANDCKHEAEPLTSAKQLSHGRMLRTERSWGRRTVP